MLHVAEPPDSPLVVVDLGCGDGTETMDLLRRGFTVFAVDKEPEAIARVEAAVRPSDRDRLTTMVAAFGDVVLPRADFVYAGLSLPFSPPQEFEVIWKQIRSALGHGGWFAGNFFGTRDSWAGEAGMTFLSHERVASLFADFDVKVFREQDEDGDSVAGAKHWHAFHVIARARTAARREAVG